MIISGIFTDLFNTPYGGRHTYFKARYYLGLAALGGNTQQKKIYIKPEDIEKVTEVLTNKLTEEEFNRYELIPFDLSEQTFSDRILALKEQIGYLGDRCLHIQYGKLQWLKNHINEDDYLWWIDAGLICDHLFPSKYVRDFNDAKNVFSDDFFNQLKQRVNDKTYFICGDRHRYYAHGKPNEKYFESNYQNRYHPIGGFFGGQSNRLNEFIDVCNSKIDTILTDGVLYSEEIIMEIVFSEKKETCVYDDFTTWRHEESPDYVKGDEKYREVFHNEHKPFYCNFFESEIRRNSKIYN